MKRLGTVLAMVGALALTACTEDGQNVVSPDASSVDAPDVNAKQGNAEKGKTAFATDPDRKAEIEDQLTDFVKGLQAKVEARRAEAGAELADGVATAPIGYYWTGNVDGETAGAEVIFEDRGNKQLDVQWVPGDERRNGRDDIGYAIAPLAGPASPAGLTETEVYAAIDRGMGTWDAQSCSGGLEIPRGSLLDWLLFDSDILHAGFAPLPEGVLGVTMPSVFVDPATGEPTDVDVDGAADYAFAVIVYNINFDWAIDGNIDVETIALHEGGHGLAQAHFGKGFLTPNGKVHFAPRAVMNAAYSGVQQSLTGTDRGGHCSMYGSWPDG
jgi:hypothetical protein